MASERRVEGSERLIALQGDTAARALCARVGGDPRCGTGWRGALQTAADLSDQDPEVLTIADEVYAFAHLMTSSDAIRTYAAAAATVVRHPPATLFLRGMLAHLDHPTDDGAPR